MLPMFWLACISMCIVTLRGYLSWVATKGNFYEGSTGWSGGAMGLGKLPVPGRPTIWIQ